MTGFSIHDCICPDCKFCDVENDTCKAGRLRYPTDGCFSFVDKKTPHDEDVLIKYLKTITGKDS